MSIFKACDIRGEYGRELNESMARQIGRGLGLLVREHGRGAVCLGGDFRRSTPALKRAVFEGLRAASAAVMDVGQGPTPLMYFAASHLNCPHVVIVTASHNPARYNGVKFMIAGRPATPGLMLELQRRIPDAVGASAAASVAPEEGYARASDFTELRNAYERHLRTKAAEISRGTADGLRSRDLKIVLDCMGGAFSAIAPPILRNAGCTVIELRCRVDPDYNRGDPNPAVDRNLEALIECVTTDCADLGVALDGDGDRAAFVAHDGVIVRPEQLGVLLVSHCFERPTVIYDLKCASILARAIEQAGGKAVMQPSGHGFIKSAIIDRGADLGVEVSGHVFFKALEGGDDGLLLALVIAHLLARTGESLAGLIGPIGWPAITPDLRIPFDGEAGAVLDRIAATCGGEVARLDGVRARYENGWALVRPSITEPLMTFRFEGTDSRAVRSIARRFLAGVPGLCQAVAAKLELRPRSRAGPKQT